MASGYGMRLCAEERAIKHDNSDRINEELIHEWTGRDDKGGVELLDDWSSRGCKRALGNRDNLYWKE